MLVADGILLRKYWFSVSDEEQQARFRSRKNDPMRRWKLSPMDVESITALGGLLPGKGPDDGAHRHPDGALVRGGKRRQAHAPGINMIAHLLSTLPFHDVPVPKIVLPERPAPKGYERPPKGSQNFVPDHAATLEG